MDISYFVSNEYDLTIKDFKKRLWGINLCIAINAER